jgi:NADH:ubiquinone oxidoreductase subunit F (NADH-binding)
MGYDKSMTGFLLPDQPLSTLDEWFATDVGGLGILRAQQFGPEGTIEEVLASGLRGRGGGGFPTGRKWAGVRAAEGHRRFVVANAAEGEPATFKDRQLMRRNPYQLVEGLIIAAFAIGAQEAFIALKASFTEEAAALTRAIQELQEAGVCPDCSITLVHGPDEYLFGEETAMLEVIEGKAPLPRTLPPYLHGLFATTPQAGWESVRTDGEAQESNPTLVNNVETLSNVPHILALGAEWFRRLGTAESPGTVVATVVGDVQRPGVGEIELGTPLGSVISDIGGGVGSGRSVKAVLSGVANAIVPGSRLDAPVSYEGLAAVGSGMGAAGFWVLDDTACIVEVARLCARFLWIESCGQCPPCKRGSEEITRLLGTIEAGAADDAHLGELQAWLAKVTDANRCYLAVEVQTVVASMLRSFPDEVLLHLDMGRCPYPRTIQFPKLVDLADGVVHHDDQHERKQPDWSYAPSS